MIKVKLSKAPAIYLSFLIRLVISQQSVILNTRENNASLTQINSTVELNKMSRFPARKTKGDVKQNQIKLF